MKLKVLTINIAGLQFNWFEGRRDVLIKQARELNPDIVFIQETTVVPERSYDQTVDLMNALDRLGGVGILSRWPFHFVQNRKFPAGQLDPYGARSGLLSSIILEGVEILLATTHLSYRREEENLRAEQGEELLKAIGYYHYDHIIVGGDFNARDSEPVIRRMKDEFTDSGDHGTTFKDRRIDYLFSSPQFRIVESKVVLNKPDPVLPSDHFGVFSEYEVKSW
jgi:endonuclease/exonuclease/phosphatase family metal-dependent hydrolase